MPDADTILRALAHLPAPDRSRTDYATTIARVAETAHHRDAAGRSSMPIDLDDAVDLLHLAALYLREHPEG